MSYLRRTDNFIASLGLESYRVGGSVRDELLDRRVKDADYMVRNATLDQIHRKIRKANPKADITKLKLRNGTHVGWRVSVTGLGLIEICLPRTEVSTGPGHGDFDIVADPNVSLEEDAKRRDITINALYRRISDGKIIDPLGSGLYALENRLLVVTYPTSFRDDPLRILRLIRFLSVLDKFRIELNTLGLLNSQAEYVTGLTQKGVSGTALEELIKILMGNNVANALRLARDSGVLKTLIPELEPMLGFEQESKWHDLTVDEHTFKALDAAAYFNFPLRVRVALLFHDSGKPASAWRGNDDRLHYYEHKQFPGSKNHEEVSAQLARKALKRLNAPNELRYDVERIIENHMTKDLKTTKVRLLRCELGDELTQDLFRHMVCDSMGKAEVVSAESLTTIQRMEKVRYDSFHQNIPTSIKDLKALGLINGKDVMEMGVTGKAVGEVLEKVLHELVCAPKFVGDREWVQRRAKVHAKKLSNKASNSQ